MLTAVSFEDRVEIPVTLHDLADFRRWAQSDRCPPNGRIDYLAGRIEVDMSPEDFLTHGVLKVEIARALSARIKEMDLGYVVSDSTRVSCPEADLSVEPDVVFVSHAALDTGRVRLIAKSSGVPDRFVEIQGAPDLVVEIVSDASEEKDCRRLPPAYFVAGVRELWLIDARGDDLAFRIHHRDEAAFVPAAVDGLGFQSSPVLGLAYDLRRRRDRRNFWAYDLVARGE